MITSMLAYLRQPHPQNNEAWHVFRMSFIFGLFVAFFLFAFQPFGMNSQSVRWALTYSFIFGLVTFVGVLAVGFIPRLSRSSWFEESVWTLAKELIWGAFNFLVIGILNYGVAKVLYGNSLGFSFLEMMYATVLVGFFPFVFMVMIGHQRMLRLAQNQALGLNQRVQESRHKDDSSVVQLAGDNQNEHLEIKEGDFLYAHAAGNYCELFYRKGEEVSKILLRTSMNKLERQLEAHPQIARTHRSYILNLHMVEHVDGNAQGFRVRLRGVSEPVMVSRSYLEDFQRRINRMS